MGPLADHENLVTLTVTEDRTVVSDQCRGALTIGPVMGCQVTRTAMLPGGDEVRLVKIVRYTDALPSAMAFEIDLHELCHTVASLQAIPDPCHIGNNGFLQHPPHTVLGAN